MWKYPDEVNEFIAKNVYGRTVDELVKLTNEINGTEFTYSKMRSYLKNHGLKTGTKGGNPKGYSRIYTPEIKQFISDNYKGNGHQTMADLLNDTFGTNYTKDQMKGYYARFKLDSGLTGQFIKGQKSWNKGVKGYMGGNKTSFKKGQMPHNWKPVGSERINVDGYVEVKVADPNKWRLKQRVIWEQHNGPIPKGHVIIFGDGNSLNLDINNLILASRNQLKVLNKNGLIKNDVELTKTGVAIADVLIKISECKKR